MYSTQQYSQNYYQMPDSNATEAQANKSPEKDYSAFNSASTEARSPSVSNPQTFDMGMDAKANTMNNMNNFSSQQANNQNAQNPTYNNQQGNRKSESNGSECYCAICLFACQMLSAFGGDGDGDGDDDD